MSAPFRLLEITGSSRIGGVETYLLRLGQALRERGHETLWVARKGKPLTRELQARNFEVFPFYRASRWNPTTLARLVHLIKTRQIQAVHTHLFSANEIGARAAKLCKIPSIGRVPALEDAAPYRGCDYVTTNSKIVARHMENQGIAPEKIRVFYNGVDTARFAQLPDTDAMRARWNVPPAAFCLACAASLTPRKGQKFLLEALTKLPQTHLVLAGEGGEAAALRALCETLKLQDRVHFAGFLPDVREVLAVADAFVLPSSLEGLPNAVLEAQAAGKAVIATDIAGTSEIVRHEKTGLLVPPQNSEALVGAVQALQNADFRAKLGQNAQKMARNEFEGRNCLERFENFVQNVAKNQKKERGAA